MVVSKKGEKQDAHKEKHVEGKEQKKARNLPGSLRTKKHGEGE
jgi:hypothetical protein